MRILIEVKNKGPRFSIRLPLRLLKYEALWRKMAEKNDSFPIVIPSGPLIYRIVKDYIKENGHLTLLNLDTAECRVFIIL